MKTIWLRLGAVMFLIASVSTGVGHYLGKTKEPLTCAVFGFAFLILMIVASLGDGLEKRIAKLEDKLSGSKTDA